MASTIIPCLRYHDAPRMIDWLCEGFGFERQLVVPDGSGGVAHAQLVLGTGMIMLGSVREIDNALGTLQSTPRVLGGTTQSPYIVVPDPDDVYRRLKEIGAEIVIEIKDESHGGRGFTCRDPEGHFWHVGSYDPWKDVAP